MNTKYVAIGALLLSIDSAMAHDVKGRHGGRITDAGAYHVELVVRAAAVDVFLSDQSEKPVAATGFKGMAVLLAGGKSQRIMLAPNGATHLSGNSSGLPADATGVVQLTGPDGQTLQAKFQ